MFNTNRFKQIALSTFVFAALLGGFQMDPVPIVLEAQAQQIVPSGSIHFGQGEASITIQGNESQSLIGKRFHLYKLFDAQLSKDGSSINYSWNTQFKGAIQRAVGLRLGKGPETVHEYEAIDYMQSLQAQGYTSDFRYFIEELRNEINKTRAAAYPIQVDSVDEHNSFTLSGLEFGYYIVDEIGKNDQSHSSASLCMVSTAAPNSQLHIKSDLPEVIKKIWEDDHLVGWNDIADAEIGQTIPYKFESELPDMNGYARYYLAFHDEMDPCLDKDLSTITLTISNSTHSYPLSEVEFAAREEENGFVVEIENLKAIVDREFPEMREEDGHYVYDQRITLNFTSKLNREAKTKPGNPGFENRVRLEYSNDPDSNSHGSTGFSPWDTVVCFTYQIDGLKINEEQERLEGAEFKLYSNADCTEEVKTIKEGSQYIVENGLEGARIQSDEKGEFQIIGLDQGTYWLKEVKAPDGYRQLLDPIEIKIEPTYSEDRENYVSQSQALLDLKGSAKIKTFWNGLLNEEGKVLETNREDGSLQLSIVNYKGTILPYTGSATVFLSLAAGIILIGLGRKNHEKKK